MSSEKQPFAKQATEKLFALLNRADELGGELRDQIQEKMATDARYIKARKAVAKLLGREYESRAEATQRALADNLVALLLCQHPAGGRACGQCKGCQLLAAGTHPDFFLLEPEEPEKPIRVDQVRELVDFVVQTAQLGGRKVVLLEPAEAMNLNSANALLKSLEEPSGDTVLLLISHQPSRLLPTIKSRCVQQACPQPSAEQSRAYLASVLPGFVVDGWFGLVASQAMPKDELNAISDAVRSAVADPATKEKFAAQYTEAVYQGPQDFARSIAANTEQWRKVATELKMTPQ